MNLKKFLMILIFLLVGCTPVEPKEQVENLVYAYFTAVASKNINSMMDYTVDHRYSSDVEKKENYQMFLKSGIKLKEITNVRKVNSDQYEVEIIYTEEVSEPETVKLTVAKISDEWKIVLGASKQE